MKALSAAASAVRHTSGAAAEALLVAAIFAALALALSPLYGPARTITGAGGVDAGRGGDAVISVADGYFGETTTATVNPGGTNAWVRGTCYQNGSLIYLDYARVMADNTATLKLGPTNAWSGGYASCIGEEVTLKRNGTWRVLASTTFNAWP